MNELEYIEAKHRHDLQIEERERREQRRFDAAVAAMQGMLAHGYGGHENIARHSIAYADALLAELDKAKP